MYFAYAMEVHPVGFGVSIPFGYVTELFST